MYTVYMKHITIGLGILCILIGGFFAINSYIYNEKQADPIQEEGNSIGENSNQNENEQKPSITPEPQKPTKPGTLTGKKWVWVETQYNDERVIVPKKKDAFTLEFKSDGSFGASTDCNGIGGNYSLNSTGIVFGQMISTLMYCEGSQENEFRTMLEHSTGYDFGSDGSLILHLKFDSGSVIFK